MKVLQNDLQAVFVNHDITSPEETINFLQFIYNRKDEVNEFKNWEFTAINILSTIGLNYTTIPSEELKRFLVQFANEKGINILPRGDVQKFQKFFPSGA